MHDQMVSLAEVLAIIEKVRQRHTPPSSYVGSVYSEAKQVCDQIGSDVLKLTMFTHKTEET